MDNVKNDEYYIQKVKKDVLFIVKHMWNVDAEELDANEVLLEREMQTRLYKKVWFLHLNEGEHL